MRVFVYRNLTKGRRGAQPVYSVQSRERGQRYGRVIDHVKDLHLINCRFIVQNAGWLRVHQTGARNVHAGVVGWVNLTDQQPCGEQIFYNPFDKGYFSDASGDKIEAAQHVWLGSMKSGERWKSQILIVK